jgi:methylase of polypeptide subunit release factors
MPERVLKRTPGRTGNHMNTDAGATALGDLVRALTALDYGTDMVLSCLGREGYIEALAGNPGAALWHLDNRMSSGEVADQRSATLSRTFFLREPVPAGEVADILGTELTEALIRAGVLAVLQDNDHEGDRVQSQIDVRPVSHPVHGGGRPVLVASDPDASTTNGSSRADHVPGVGRAPLTLLDQVPFSPTESLLDLGTGSGVLALTLPAGRTIATDVNPRALDYARASQRSVSTSTASNTSSDSSSTSGATVEFREGSWFDPVDGELFTRIVSNPPFVIGPPEEGQVYRDSGLELDSASRLVVEGACEHLAAGGTAHLLGAWVTGLSESPASRVAGWIPESGIRAWVVQRDEVTPSMYARTWVADASLDLRSSQGRERTARWLDYMQEHQVARIGMGYVHLERIDGPSEVTFEVLDTPDLGYIGDEVEEYFTRAAWLSHADSDDVLDSRFQVRPGLARENVETATIGTEDMPAVGFQPEVLRLTRTEGPRFSHEIDSPLSSVVAGLSPQGLSLRDTASLYCAVNGLDEDEFVEALVPLVVDLVRHGMILPAEIVDIDDREHTEDDDTEEKEGR